MPLLIVKVNVQISALVILLNISNDKIKEIPRIQIPIILFIDMIQCKFINLYNDNKT